MRATNHIFGILINYNENYTIERSDPKMVLDDH